MNRERTVVRTRLTRLVMMLAATLVALLGAESAARAFPDRAANQIQDDPDDRLWADPEWRSPPSHVYRADSSLGYTHAASAVADVKVAEHPKRAFRFRTNSYGLRRDEDIDIPKPPNTFRVLVLGDSQTSGYTTNTESYPGRLEEIWQDRSGAGTIEILNAGVDGYGPQQAFLWYLEYGVPLEADLVIFAVYAGNDIDDLAHGIVDGVTIDAAAGHIGPLRTPWTWLSLHSQFVQLVAPSLRRAFDEVRPPTTAISEDRLIRLMRECHGCWLQSLKQAVRARSEPEPVERAFRRLEQAFRLVDASVADEGGTLAILLIPTKNQVEPDDEPGAIGRANRLLELPPTDATYDSVVYARIRDAAERSGVTVVDPLVTLQASARDQRLYYRRDWHLNPNGNKALAAAIDQALATELRGKLPTP